RDAKQVARVGEKSPDVVRPIRELIPGIGVVPALDANPVEAAPPVGVNQSTDEPARILLDDIALPRLEHDRARVLATGAVLWQQARPRLPVRGDHGALAILPMPDARQPTTKTTNRVDH